MWFARLKNENLKLYLRGVRILEEKQVKRYRVWLASAVIYVISIEIYRDFIEEEWERSRWTPDWVLNCRREHYINNEYNRIRSGLAMTFTISNWDPESKMVYHVDLHGNHRYEKIVLPPYHYGALNDTKSIERFYKLSVYNMNKRSRFDLDNYLRYKTITLGDWLTAIYYTFNVWTKSFDPFFYKPEFLYLKDKDLLTINLQTPNKPDTILRILDSILTKISYWSNSA